MPLLTGFIYKRTSTTVKFCSNQGNGTPLQYSCLENSMDGGAWWATVHGVAKSQTRLSDFTFTFHFHVWLWKLDHKEGWALKNWCFWTVVLEKTLDSPLDCKEIQPVHSEGDQPWDFFGRNDAKAETPILWPPAVKNWLIGKNPDAGKVWRQEEKGMTEDEMVGWHHQLDGHEFEQVPGIGDGQGSLACCNPWGHKVTHDRVTELNYY